MENAKLDMNARKRKAGSLDAESAEEVSAQQSATAPRAPGKGGAGSKGITSLRGMEVDKVVGGGTFGVVFKATLKETGQRVALKRLMLSKIEEVQCQGFPVQAIREIKILKAVNHVNIVKLISIVSYVPGDDDEGEETFEKTHGFVAGDIFMLFEYVDFDLSGLLKCREVHLTDLHIRSYMKQLLEGVNFLHTNKIIHRDIKGPNVLVTRENVIKIADLGLARSYRNEQQKFTNSNSVVTLWYRSPELLLGTRNYGAEIDIWSVGCLFGEMKTRDAMFKGATEPEQLEKIYRVCGSPVPGSELELYYRELPEARDEKFNFQRVYPNMLRRKYESFGESSLSLLEKFLDLNPRTRITASKALDHDYFWEAGHQIPRPEELPRFTVEVATDMSETERMKAERAAKIAAEEERLKADRDREAGGGPGQGAGRGRGGGTRPSFAAKITIIKGQPMKYSVSKGGAGRGNVGIAAAAAAAAQKAAPSAATAQASAASGAATSSAVLPPSISVPYITAPSSGGPASAPGSAPGSGVVYGYAPGSQSGGSVSGGGSGGTYAYAPGSSECQNCSVQDDDEYNQGGACVQFMEINQDSNVSFDGNRWGAMS